jgi:hypothetical protein
MSKGVAVRHIRLASAEEIEGIRDKADLMPGCTWVYALDAEKGTPDIAVVRRPVEVNPVIYGSETTDQRRLRFIYALEARLLGAGIDRYYSMFDATKTEYIRTMEHFGFERISPVPEIRMLRIIK